MAGCPLLLSLACHLFLLRLFELRQIRGAYPMGGDASHDKRSGEREHKREGAAVHATPPSSCVFTPAATRRGQGVAREQLMPKNIYRGVSEGTLGYHPGQLLRAVP